jgi:hypothetical protein
MASLLKHTVSPSGGDFTSLQACLTHLAASHANFVTADVYGEIEISGTWSGPDTTAANIIGLTTDATRYLSIYTSGAARHAGVYSASKYLLQVTNAVALGVDTVQYVRIDGLQVETINPAGSNRYVFSAGGFTDNANNLWLSNCIFKGHNHASLIQVLLDFSNADNVDAYIWNCIGYNLKALALNYGINVTVTSNGTVHVYSCTFIGGAYGLKRNSGAVTAKNCYFGGSLSGDYDGTITKTNCASSDTTADGTAPKTGILVSETADSTHAGFTSIGADSENFHLKAGSPLIGVGVDTHGEGAPLNFTTDIDGDSRS